MVRLITQQPLTSSSESIKIRELDEQREMVDVRDGNSKVGQIN
jgi:hypothetical protein